MVASVSFARPRACRNLPNFLLLGFVLLAGLLSLLQISHLFLQPQFPVTAQPLNRSSFDLDYDGFPLRSARLHLDLHRTHQELAREAALQRTALQELANDVLVQRLDAVERGLHNARLIESLLEEKVNDLEEESRILHRHLSLSVEFAPLQDGDAFRAKTYDTLHYFMSSIPGRGAKRGPPELFYFPSRRSYGRFLCLKGNDTHYGSKNFFAFAFKDGLPLDSHFLPGITLISDSQWDFLDPWVSMASLLQFVHWKMKHRCARADRLFLYHFSEHRTAMGGWISNVLNAAGLPSSVESLNDGERPVCFKNAVLSRRGTGGLTDEIATAMYNETRCRVRQSCNVSVVSHNSSRSSDPVQVTLLLRTGSRGFINEGAWQEVVKQQCEQVQGCTWSAVYIGNFSFCEQVRKMTETDILVSAHGSQLTNMLFMRPGGRLLEMLPGGWLELAGFSQYVYRSLARLVGVRHEGYWRDPSTPICPNPTDSPACFRFYKDQPLGLNATHIGEWLRAVILDVVSMRSSNAPSNEADSGPCKCTD